MQSSHDRTPTRTALLAGIVPVLFGLNGAMAAETQVFDNPTVDGITVDRCLSWDRTCDWPAAHEFCACVGYVRALDWTWAWKGVTKTLGSLETCTADEETVCGGFLEITCARGPDVAPPEPPVEPEPVVEPEPPEDLGANDVTPTPPAPPAAPAIFPGALQDYTLELDPSNGDWIVTDTRPGSPDGATIIGIATEYLFFSDVVFPGPAILPPGADPQSATAVSTISGAIDDQPEAIGSGPIVARLERGAHDCLETGPSNDRLYTTCDLQYSLENTASAPVWWTSGITQTAKANGQGLDTRDIGYGAASIQPGEKITFRGFCVVPPGEGVGSWSASGTGELRTEGQSGGEISWKLAADCP